MKSKWLISVSLFVCLLMTFALPMCAPAPLVEEEAPPVEEEELAKSIRAYMCGTTDINEQHTDLIKEKLGVTVFVQRLSCGEARARLIAEAPNFHADAVLQACGSELALAKREGWTIPYDSPIWRDAGIYKDPDNCWWSEHVSTFVLVGNKDLLAEAGYAMPESWDDLLDPKWKGEIVMPSPTTSGTAFRMVYAFITLYGFNEGKTGTEAEEAGWEYWEALDKNVHHYTRSGNAPSELVGKGEFMLGITSHAKVLDRIKVGYPIVWSVPKEGTAYDISGLFILKGCKELYTCEKIVDLFGGRENAKLRAAQGYITRFPDIPSELFGGIPTWIPDVDIQWAYDNRDRLCDEWKDRLLVGRPEPS